MADVIPIYHDSPLPDDVLIDAARMFYPDVPGLDTYAICAAALKRLREKKEVDGMPNSEAVARWRASDPVCIAYFAMMFVGPVLAGKTEHHAWHARLMDLRKERERRFLRTVKP